MLETFVILDQCSSRQRSSSDFFKLIIFTPPKESFSLLYTPTKENLLLKGIFQQGYEGAISSF